MSSSKKSFNFLSIIALLLLISLVLEITYTGSAEVSTDEPIDCIIIQWSGCPDCVTKYKTYIEPFYHQFQDNDSIDFAFIDAYTNYDFFYDEMTALNITVGDYGVRFQKLK